MAAAIPMLATAGAGAGATALGTTAATGMGAGMGLAGSSLALPAAGAGAGLAAGGASMAPMGALAAQGMGAQGLIAPALSGAGTGLTAGAAEAAGMGGAQGLMGSAATSPNIAAQFASASPDSFRMTYALSDAMRDVGKGAESGSKAMRVFNAVNPPQAPNREIGRMPFEGQQAAPMAGLLGDPVQQLRMRRLRNLGLLGAK